MSQTSGRSVPLVVTSDEMLRAEAVRLSAAAGVEPVVVSDLDEALTRWRAADLVLVGADLADLVAATGPVRRPHVHLAVFGAATPPAYRAALALGAENVLELPDATDWLIDRLGDLAEDTRRRAPVIGVVGGSGGTGASTLAAALTQSAATTGSALLVDLDPHGPGAALLLGIGSERDVGWEALSERGGRMAGHALRDALPRRGALSVLGWRDLPTAPGEETMREALDAGARGHDLVVVDLPRGWTVPPGVVARLDLVVVTVRPDVVGLASAGRTILRWGTERVIAVVRGPTARSRLLEEVAGAPVVAHMRDQRGLGDAVDLGFGPLPRPRGPLHRAVGAVLDHVQAVRP